MSSLDSSNAVQKLTPGQAPTLPPPLPDEAADQRLQDIIRRHLNGLSNEAVRERLSSPATRLADLRKGAALLPTGARRALLSDAMEAGFSADSVGRRYCAKLPLFFRHFEVKDRVWLVEQLLANPRRKMRSSMVAAVLRASNSPSELRSVIGAVTIKSLLSFNSPTVKEIVALSVLTTRLDTLCKRKLPDPPAPNASRRLVRAKLKELSAFLGECAETVERSGFLNNTQAARDLRTAIRFNRSYLSLEQKKPRGKLPRPASALRALYDLMHTKVPLEFALGLFWSNERNSKGANLTRWKASEVAAMGQAVSRFAAPVLLTPKLREVRLVRGNDWTAYRSDSGIIRFAEGSLGDKDWDNLFECPTFVSRFLHEIGHALQLAGDRKNEKSDEFGRIVQNGDALREFPQFAALSGWRVHSVPFSLDAAGLELTIDGQRIDLTKPRLENGEWRKYCVLSEESDPPELTRFREPQRPKTKFYRTVFSFAFHSRFVREQDGYSEISPWEDYAMAFPEYVLKPERLAVQNPYKFLFLDDNFDFYPERPELRLTAMEELSRVEEVKPTPSLETSSKVAVSLPPLQERFLDLFKRLQPFEQTAVLAHLESVEFKIKSGIPADPTTFIEHISSENERHARFVGFISDPPLLEAVKDTVAREVVAQYMPGLFLAKRMLLEGHDVGLLSGRSSREAVRVLLKFIQPFISRPEELYRVPEGLLYCVNEPDPAIAFHSSSTHSRILEVLLGRVNGERPTPDGSVRSYLKRYDWVMYVDCEHKTLTDLDRYVHTNALYDRLIIVDANLLDPVKEWERFLITQRGRGRSEAPHGLVLFNPDGTLCDTDLAFHIVDRSTGERLFSYNQTHLRRHPREYWLERAREAFPKIDPQNLQVDYSDSGPESTLKRIVTHRNILHRRDLAE